MTSTKPKTTRKTSTTAIGWFPTTPATDSAIIDMASARQVALRVRLRNHYWQTECKPLSETTVALLRRKMTMIDPQDAMPDEQVSELLSEHYGFVAAGGGWAIPDLIAARGGVLESIAGKSQEAACAGLISAAVKRARLSGRELSEAEKEAIRAEVFGTAPSGGSDGLDF